MIYLELKSEEGEFIKGLLLLHVRLQHMAQKGEFLGTKYLPRYRLTRGSILPLNAHVVATWVAHHYECERCLSTCNPPVSPNKNYPK